MADRNTRAHEPRSTEDLHRASLAVQFDVIMLWQSQSKLQELSATFASSVEERFQNNLLIHSFLLAARNLLDFLYSHGARTTDLIAEDFFDDPGHWQRQRIVPDPIMANGDLKRGISRRLSHLTWDRAEGTRPLWGVFPIAWKIGLALQDFLQLADDENIHPYLREDIELGMALLKADLDSAGGIDVKMASAQELVDFDDLEYFGGSGASEDAN